MGKIRKGKKRGKMARVANFPPKELYCGARPVGAIIMVRTLSRQPKTENGTNRVAEI